MNWLVGTAYAQGFQLGLPLGVPGGKCAGGACSDFGAYFHDLILLGIYVAMAVAVIMVAYAGFIYAHSQGQADQVSKAKELVAGTFTGLALLLLIRLILPTLGL